MRELALADGFRMIAVCVDDDDDVSIKKEVFPAWRIAPAVPEPHFSPPTAANCRLG